MTVNKVNNPGKRPKKGFLSTRTALRLQCVHEYCCNLEALASSRALIFELLNEFRMFQFWLFSEISQRLESFWQLKRFKHRGASGPELLDLELFGNVQHRG